MLKILFLPCFHGIFWCRPIQIRFPKKLRFYAFQMPRNCISIPIWNNIVLNNPFYVFHLFFKFRGLFLPCFPVFSFFMFFLIHRFLVSLIFSELKEGWVMELWPEYSPLVLTLPNILHVILRPLSPAPCVTLSITYQYSHVRSIKSDNCFMVLVFDSLPWHGSVLGF